MELYVSITLCVLLEYLIGSIQPGIILSRCMGKGDIREKDSHSTGATNVYRTLGKNRLLLSLLLIAARGFSRHGWEACLRGISVQWLAAWQQLQDIYGRFSFNSKEEKASQQH
ncbi:MAG: hypothetical protein FNP40_00300 [Dehalobacter sp. 4CP]|nr:hypothetical protein [Dehalobacter sp. 4CP]